ncbi:MAG: type II secretion system minor pseudopilin GspH [Gammaproteobacteria bacterium]|nr:type II secretion system minor pseudopilin GspH [Gammaproteobacteria bacterium]
MIPNRCMLVGKHRLQGFTLFEVMVVVFIIGIIVTFGGLSISQHSDRYIEDEAKRIHHLMQLARDEAVLLSQEYSLLLTNKGYRFARLTGAKWEPIADDQLFRDREFPPDLNVSLMVYENKADLDDAEKPAQIYLLSSGEVTPFKLTLSGESELPYTVTGQITGQLAYLRPDANEVDFGG